MMGPAGKNTDQSESVKTAAKAGGLSGAGLLNKETLVRIVSGLVLSLIAFVAVIAGPASFLVLLVVASGIMAWEWGGIVRQHGGPLALTVHLGGLAAIAVALYLGHFPAAFLALFAALALVAILKWNKPHIWWSLAGVAYTLLPVMALYWFRTGSALGVETVIYLVTVVAATDTGAYFTGRLLGGPKFAPRISPNKTWSGFWGGLASGGIVSILFALWLGEGSPLILALIGVTLSGVSQMGDLFESHVKRSFGVKDASRVIPGHGGVMDRVDGLVFAAVGAAMVSLLGMVIAPGSGLLVWR